MLPEPESLTEALNRLASGSELPGIEDLDFEHGYIHVEVAKGGRPRTVVSSKPTLEALQVHLHGRERSSTGTNTNASVGIDMGKSTIISLLFDINYIFNIDQPQRRLHLGYEWFP